MKKDERKKAKSENQYRNVEIITIIFNTKYFSRVSEMSNYKCCIKLVDALLYTINFKPNFFSSLLGQRMRTHYPSWQPRQGTGVEGRGRRVFQYSAYTGYAHEGYRQGSRIPYIYGITHEGYSQGSYIPYIQNTHVSITVRFHIFYIYGIYM